MGCLRQIVIHLVVARDGHNSHIFLAMALNRFFTTAARRSLKIGLIPGDGIGREVLPVNQFSRLYRVVYSHVIIVQAAQDAILALGSSIPKPEFISLDAGFEYFTKHGEALPNETVQLDKFYAFPILV